MTIGERPAPESKGVSGVASDADNVLSATAAGLDVRADKVKVFKFLFIKNFGAAARSLREADGFAHDDDASSEGTAR